MAAALQRFEASTLLPPIPWRDPHTVSPEQLATYIWELEKACQAHPDSADLRTCLGMAYAMNFEVYKSMDALDTAIRLAPTHFFARLKHAELYFRLRALEQAEQETRHALDLAENVWQASLAWKLLLEIGRLRLESTQKPAWSKPLAHPTLLFLACAVLLCLLFLVSR